MAYQTGYAANEFDLQEKLNAFILSIDGWRKISQPSKFESVYFSSGEDGYKDIYIKTRAGMREFPYYYSSNQRDFGDGYVGYMNMFAYQYYRQNGDGYDGYGEAGRLGPFIYFVTSSQNNNSLYSQRIATTTMGANKKWDWVNYMYTLPDGENYASGYSNTVDNTLPTLYDGKRYIYYMSQGQQGLHRFDLSIERNRILDTYWEWCSSTWGNVNLYLDPVTRKEFIYLATDMRTYYSLVTWVCPDPLAKSWTRYDIDDQQLETGFQGPIWRNISGGAGYNITSTYGAQIWDGHNYIYRLRGSSTGDWMKYNVKDDTWTDFSISYPIPQTDSDESNLVWLDKATSGFSYHRLYYLRSQSGSSIIYYIDIDENTGNPVGAWTSAGSAPGSEQYKKLFHNQTNRWYVTQRTTTSGGKTISLYYAPMTSGTLSWTLDSQDYGPDTTAYVYRHDEFYANTAVSRVKTHLSRPTHYWFFGSKDHITVVTYAGGDFAEATTDYSFCYAGALDPFSSTTPHAKTTAKVYPGSNVEIPIQRFKGEFYVGQKITIANVTEDCGMIVTGALENIPRRFMPCETFVISSVSPGVSITATTLQNTYAVGARIAYDPQPVGITMNGLDRIQMLNSVNSINTAGSIDMAENICQLSTVKDAIVNMSGNDARFGGYVLWPVIAGHFGNDSSYSGSEARGILRGIFAVSGTAGLSNRDTVAVGGNTYILLSVASGKTYKYVFGPIT